MPAKRDTSDDFPILLCLLFLLFLLLCSTLIAV